ncbi:type III secretion system cytoplasmic ring protein SctQ [Bordetella sp. BOR01]|uniref:type III secretion system cytoplasmic ring protein SctQ n=1 Tax=Bordetella sp. BOR01 TaxID=2854779 RepID=UPI0021060AD9|nr:type III secretion system cytoplasmic ring protein SctQ [Bordetella sp. BOR01]
MNLAPRIALPRLNGNEAQALSLIARHGADLRVALAPSGGATADAPASAWRLAFTPGAVEPLVQAASLHAELEWAGAALRLSLPPAAPAAWLAARLPDLQPGPVPEALQAMAFEALLGEVLAALEQSSSNGPAYVRSLDAGAARLPHIWTLTVRAEATGDTGYAVLETDGLGLMLLAGLLSQTPKPDNSIDVDALPVALRATVGAVQLPAAQLRSLQPQDVVLFDEYYVGPQGDLWLTLPQGQGLRVRAEQSTYIVTQGWTSIMTQTTNAEPADDGTTDEPLDLDAVPVRLTFDLGERSLSLAQLKRLQPGETFDLQRPLADGPVMIRANGALVGTGELVEVDGRIGVTIATLGKGAA